MRVIISGVCVDVVKLPFNGQSIRYISTARVTPNELIKFFEELTQKPGIKWIATPHEQFRKKILVTGMACISV